MKRNLKKALSVVLAASLMATSSAFTVLAAGEEIPPESVSLMPADADAVTGGTATMENGSLTLTAGDADTAFTWEVNQDVNITLLTNLYFNIEQDGGFDLSIASTGGPVSNDMSPSLSRDFGNLEILGSKTDFGTPITTPSISAADLVGENSIFWIGAFIWNENLPDDGVITVKSVTVTLTAGTTLTLSDLCLAIRADIPDFTALEEALNRVTELDVEKYTEEELEPVVATLEHVVMIVGNLFVTQEDVDLATQALNAALDALEPITDPTDPSTPTYPSDPTEPEPTDPTEPTEVTEPTDPVQPTESTDPTDSTNPSKPATTDAPAKIPDTGENTSFMMAGAVLLLASAGTVLLTRKKIRSR